MNLHIPCFQPYRNCFLNLLIQSIIVEVMILMHYIFSNPCQQHHQCAGSLTCENLVQKLCYSGKRKHFPGNPYPYWKPRATHWWPPHFTSQPRCPGWTCFEIFRVFINCRGLFAWFYFIFKELSMPEISQNRLNFFKFSSQCLQKLAVKFDSLVFVKFSMLLV